MWSSPDVVFDGANRLIIINLTGEVNIREDIYNRWKLWTIQEDNLKWAQAMNNIGGDPLPGGEFLGTTFFLLNNWKIQLRDSIIIEGNLFTDDGSFPFVSPEGVVIAQSKISTLVERVSSADVDNARIFV